MAPGQSPDHASPDPLFGPKDARERPEPQPGLTEGRVLGDFRLVRLIGGGGMGDVWEAKQLSLGGRRVALKFIRPDKVGERAMELFAREARAGGRLNYPGIVGVYGFGETEGYAWIAMEFVEGAWTLRDFLADMAREEDLPPDYDLKVAEFVALAADAIHVAHEAGVIHRDLKPQNILIGPDHRPRIADFGLARITDETEMSRTGEFAGTYHYMSPEQVTARRMGIDLRTDVFSLGVVLYEMLTLRRPFNGDTTHQVAAQIVTKDPPDPRTIRSKVPRDLAVIVGKALEKDPEKRFQTMAELGADLRRVLTHEPILAQPPTMAERVAKWVRRNPTRSAVGASAVVGIAIVSILLVQLINTNEFLKKSNSQLTDANSQLARRDHEAKVFGLISELAYFETLDDDAHTYTREQSRPASEWWLEGAHHLVDGVQADAAKGIAWSPGLKEVEAELVALRTKARLRTPEEIEEDRRASTTAERRTWRFDDTRDEYKHGELVKLVEDLRWLATELETSERSTQAPDARKAWDDAIASIMGSERYRDTKWPCGSRLTPQLGLVPIGQDPDSGLWEFAHLLTGQPAQRGANRKLVPEPAMGLVFVLLPGGYVPVAEGEGSEIQDKVLTTIPLDPFFMSKYEMTNFQWDRIGGRRYAGEVDLGPLLPVTHVSWSDCFVTIATRLPWCRLPSEAQWEYACRATTTTPWWTGPDPLSLHGAANLRPTETDKPTDILPVGSLRANRFGLHDVHGNAWEWCRDALEGTGVARRRGDGALEVPNAGEHVLRGGGRMGFPAYARSSQRYNNTPGYHNNVGGLRPIRWIAPEERAR